MNDYDFKDFSEKDAWLVFRLDTQIKDQPVDIYMIMDLPTQIILTHEIVETELSQIQVEKLIKEAQAKKGSYPLRIILATGDPSEVYLRVLSKKLGIDFEAVPGRAIEPLVIPLKQSFAQQFFSTSTFGYENVEDELDRESARSMLPDSYDPCSCASGKKYKFCCKKILREIMEAMVAAEERQLAEALKWINKAKNIVGETAEVLCREAIVYSYFDPKKSEDLLDKCLAINPNHPRAHYIRGINFKEQGDFTSAIAAYETAIQNYPQSDYYHLNEVYNNLGTLFYEMGHLDKAKLAWEKALLFVPSDKVTRQNLSEFIYDRPIG